MRRSRVAGFTLIELLIVIVIIGILAAIAIPSFRSTKGKAYATSLKTDLRNLATAEETYYFQYSTYSSDLAALKGFTRTKGVTITFGTAAVNGWSASASNPQAVPSKCAMFVGGVSALAPATEEAEIKCQ